MGSPRSKLMNRMYGLLILVMVLQAVAIGLAIRYAGEGLKRDQTLLTRTGVMMDELFPGLKQDLSGVSRKTSEIKSDLSGLRNRVEQVDSRVGSLGMGVQEVDRKVAVLDKNISGFVGDKSGLIWGHSLNPYVLAGLLLAILGALPLSIRYVVKRHRLKSPVSEAGLDVDDDSFTGRLDKLSHLVEKIRFEEGRSQGPGPELRRLMDETERLIREARSDLAQISAATKIVAEDTEKSRERLH
jgi:hypothetical protein